MHQYKELIDDINIKYIEMPNKLECLISVMIYILMNAYHLHLILEKHLNLIIHKANKVTSLTFKSN